VTRCRRSGAAVRKPPTSTPTAERMRSRMPPATRSAPAAIEHPASSVLHASRRRLIHRARRGRRASGERTRRARDGARCCCGVAANRWRARLHDGAFAFFPWSQPNKQDWLHPTRRSVLGRFRCGTSWAHRAGRTPDRVQRETHYVSESGHDGLLDDFAWSSDALGCSTCKARLCRTGRPTGAPCHVTPRASSPLGWLKDRKTRFRGARGPSAAPVPHRKTRFRGARVHFSRPLCLQGPIR
jgi:hypothetical protein